VGMAGVMGRLKVPERCGMGRCGLIEVVMTRSGLIKYG